MLPQRANMHVRSSAALLLWGWLAIGFIARASPAAAHSPPGVDPSLAPWFRSLQEPVNNGSCCAERDCELVRAKIARDHYEVFLEGAWRRVPPAIVLKRHDNPTGSAVLCHIHLEMICFIPAAEM
jgi:hypothetical protein